jgi:hypothetical protein
VLSINSKALKTPGLNLARDCVPTLYALPAFRSGQTPSTLCAVVQLSVNQDSERAKSLHPYVSSYWFPSIRTAARTRGPSIEQHTSRSTTGVTGIRDSRSREVPLLCSSLRVPLRSMLRIRDSDRTTEPQPIHALVSDTAQAARSNPHDGGSTM